MSSKKSSVSGKRILYITTQFFEYPEKIKKSIEKQGGSVTLCYFNIKTQYSTILLNLNAKWYRKYRLRQEQMILKNNKNKKFDFILIQHPYYLSDLFLNSLRKHHKEAFFINYNWDAISTGNYLKYSYIFDKVVSFDRYDVENNRDLHYLPLFYTDDFVLERKEKIEYDLSFIGVIGISENRYEFLDEIKGQCDKADIYFFQYLFASRNSYFKMKYLKGKTYSNIKHKKLSLKDIAAIYSKSNVIIDYNNPKQSGLTMRTFEVLGSGCKLITTNKNISKEPFYSEDYIQIIDFMKPELDVDFITDTLKQKINNISKYHIDNWVNNLFYVS